MKTLLFTLFIVLTLSISCKEEERMGVCTACCDSSGKEVCKGDVTDKCAQNLIRIALTDMNGLFQRA